MDFVCGIAVDVDIPPVVVDVGIAVEVVAESDELAVDVVVESMLRMLG